MAGLCAGCLLAAHVSCVTMRVDTRRVCAKWWRASGQGAAYLEGQDHLAASLCLVQPLLHLLANVRNT
jgi:hypothetical protein